MSIPRIAFLGLLLAAPLARAGDPAPAVPSAGGAHPVAAPSVGGGAPSTAPATAVPPADVGAQPPPSAAGAAVEGATSAPVESSGAPPKKPVSQAQAAAPPSSDERAPSLAPPAPSWHAQRRGEFVIGGGVTGTSLPAAGRLMRPALNLFASYASRTYALGLSTHISILEDYDQEEASFGAFSVFGRYYLTRGNVAPFVGGGLAMVVIEEVNARGGEWEHFHGSGLSVFGEIGLELFRLRNTRLITSLRADAPFFVLEATRYGLDDHGYLWALESGRRRYEVPLMLNVGVGF